MYDSIFNDNDMKKLQSLLKKNKASITSAESCTGGLISYLITQVSGSSEIFNGGIVTYSNDIKHKELNVSKETLQKHGAVSIEVVNEMLSNVKEKFDANYALATSGIAGPNGGSKQKPVGTVIIGFMGPKGSKKVEKYHFFGQRNEVQMQAAKTALKEILNFLQKTVDK